MNYTKSEPEATISFTYIQPAPVMLAMFKTSHTGITE